MEEEEERKRQMQAQEMEKKRAISQAKPKITLRQAEEKKKIQKKLGDLKERKEMKVKE